MKVIILCGGLGSRLAEETKLIPKPMVKIGKIPIIQHIINIYKKNGFHDFILATGYKSEIIKKYFKNKKNVSCIFTGKNTATGGRLLRLKKYLKNEEDFMLTYGDGVSNQNIKKLLRFHKKHKKIGTLTSVKPPARFGEVFLKGDRVRKFEEKSQLNSNWINGGFFVFNFKIFSFFKKNNPIFEKDIIPKIVLKKKAFVLKHYGFWHPMDTMQEKRNLNKLWKSGVAPWRIW